MSDSYNLSGLRTTLSEMSDEELRQHMLGIRANRRTVKAKAVELSVKGKKDGTNTKADTKQAIRNLSSDQVAQLLLQLQQGGQQ